MESQAYEVIQLDENSWRIEDSYVRCFLFAGRDKALLVDSGLGTGDLKAVVEKLTPLPVTLVNTHADSDHTGCNGQFSPALMHPAEYEQYSLETEHPLPMVPLWGGDVIDIGGRQFEVILIPGHTPGSIALLDTKNRLLIAGDSVQCSAIYMFGRGRNLPAYLASLQRLAGVRDKFDTVYPCHGPFPVPATAVDSLASVAKGVLAGEITGQKTVEMDTEVLLFGTGETQLLCDL